MKICAATGNAGKLRELRRILEAQGHEVVSQKELGITTIIVTHDHEEAVSLADRVIVMNHGTIVESGSVDDVFFHPKEDYTRRLLDAIPNRRTSLRKRIKIAPTAQWPTGSDKKAAPPAEKEE